MLFSKVLACASLVASVVAQTTSRIAFTVLPQSIQAGKPITLHWAGGDGSPVTITLQQGTTSNLKTVQLVTGSATGTSYTWTVPKTLPNAENYAFRIQQSDSQPNYTGMITLTGGSSSGGTSTEAAAVTTASASASESASESESASAPASSAASSYSSVYASANSTAPATTAVSNSSITAVGTAPVSSGTGASLSRNTTLSRATLSASSSAAATTAATTSSSGGSDTTQSTAPAPTGAAGIVGSNLAFLICAFAAVVYLG